MLKELKDIVIEADTKRPTLVLNKLPYARDALEPVMSKESVDLHYGKLSQGYVDRYNKKEGDDKFNFGGAHLHNLYWAHLQPPTSGNTPSGNSLELIDKKFGSFQNFKEKFIDKAKSLQGSGWVYMDVKGKLGLIANQDFQRGTEIVMLVDMWEHSYLLDKTKDKYLNDIWRVINWSIINDRLQGE
jgi:superoxide dismutase, Fe-Mn family|tara:strand:+ start:356 stop:913 length:558 start_codon:yes stop_codon:yes gene_type:complete